MAYPCTNHPFVPSFTSVNRMGFLWIHDSQLWPHVGHPHLWANGIQDDLPVQSKHHPSSSVHLSRSRIWILFSNEYVMNMLDSRPNDLRSCEEGKCFQHAWCCCWIPSGAVSCRQVANVCTYIWCRIERGLPYDGQLLSDLSGFIRSSFPNHTNNSKLGSPSLQHQTKFWYCPRGCTGFKLILI